MRILGCGNPDRVNDAAGLLVPRRLRDLWIQALELGSEALALLDACSGQPDAPVVDAVSASPP